MSSSQKNQLKIRGFEGCLRTPNSSTVSTDKGGNLYPIGTVATLLVVYSRICSPVTGTIAVIHHSEVHKQSQ